MIIRTALVDLGIDDVDPGLAPEGARCGDDSLCVNRYADLLLVITLSALILLVNRKCMPVASLKIGPLSCPRNCHDHGQVILDLKLAF